MKMTDKEKQSVDQGMVDAVAKALLSDEEFVRLLAAAMKRQQEVAELPAMPDFPGKRKRFRRRYNWNVPFGLVVDKIPDTKLG